MISMEEINMFIKVSKDAENAYACTSWQAGGGDDKDDRRDEDLVRPAAEHVKVEKDDEKRDHEDPRKCDFVG